MKTTLVSSIFALMLGFAGALSAAEMRDVVVESVDEAAGTVTISGVTYEVGDDVSIVGLAPGQQVNIEHEDNADGEPVLTNVVPQN